MPRGEGIKPLGSLFDVYKKKLKAPQGHVIDVFCETIDDLYGFSIKKEEVKYSSYSKTLSLQTSGMIKTEVLLHKKEILTHLRGRLGDKSAPKEII